MEKTLEDFLRKLKEDTTYRHWCGEFLKPSFIKTAAQTYPKLYTVKVYRKKVLKAFGIWANEVHLKPEAEGETLYPLKP